MKKIFIIGLFACLAIMIALFISDNKVEEFYVLTSKKSNDFLQSKVQRNITNDWVVDSLQKQTISKQLNRVLRFRVLPVSSYKVQLLNYEKEGVKYTYFNAFCSLLDDASNSLWMKELYFVYDGGKCFFHGIYNLDEQRILFLYFNSSAV